ncbi:MAG: alpha-galactosidase [bacterium]|nr:alpha-galactosidase [bacterium]
MKYEENQVRLVFSQDVSYEVDGNRKSLKLTEDVCRDENIEVHVSVCRENGLKMRMTVRNVGSVPIVLRDMNYMRIYRTEDFSIRGTRLDECLVYRQGRHKNDIPSVFCPGVKDERLQDAAGGMLETGDKNAAGEAAVIHSDSLTMFHAEGMNLLFGFLTGRNSFVDCVIHAGRGEEAKEESALLEGELLKCGCCSIHVFLEPGKEFVGEELWICTGEKENELICAYAAKKAERYGARRREKAPSVFCTWYYYGLTVTYEDVAVNLAQIQEKKLPFDVFQVDEGWEITLGEWEPNQKFPKPMKEVAEEIKRAGMTAGIWTSPFIAHETASIWKRHPEWKLCDKEGNPCLFHMNDTVYHVFDITNPATYPYFTELYEKLTFDWGYTYHKLDFTRAAVIYENADFFDKTVSLPQAYYRAVAAIRKGMGEESYFLMCGGLYDPIIGLVDGQRMGADVLSMWQSNVNRDGKALPFTVKQNLLRYYMNQWWNNDPDALMVRRQPEMERGLRLTLGLLHDEEVKTAVVNQYIGGGLVCSTEPLETIEKDRLYQLKHILPVLEREVTVMNLFGEGRFPHLVDVLVKKKGWHTVVCINWDDEKEIPAELVLSEEVTEGRTAKKTEDAEEQPYLVAEFYSGTYRTDALPGQKVCLGTILPHASAVFKVAAYDRKMPYIVGSDAHYSMGGEVDVLKVENHNLIFEMNALFDTRSTYQILLPDGFVTEDKKKLVKISIEGAGKKQVVIPLKQESFYS